MCATIIHTRCVVCRAVRAFYTVCDDVLRVASRWHCVRAWLWLQTGWMYRWLLMTVKCATCLASTNAVAPLLPHLCFASIR